MIARAVTVLGVAALLAACGARPTPAQRAPSSPAAQPALEAKPAPVVVVVVVDQFAAWIAAERLSALPADGGFARLRREGWYAPELRYEHATTSTAPGHSTLFTGLPPRESGIFTNELPDARGQEISILADEATRAVDTVPPQSSSSAKRLRVETLADALRRERADATILALSLKDRGAIFGGGQRPDASLWYDRARGRLTTSTAFAEALPDWAQAANAGLPREIQSTVWQPLDAAWVAAHAATPDDAPGEGDLGGLGTHFPHELSRTEKPTAVFRATPEADAFLVSVAVRALDAYAERKGPRLLAISLSAFDYIGHVFGPDSWESWDALLRLDQLLSVLFRALDQRFHGEYSLLLTADHGSVTLPETVGNARARPWCGLGKPDPLERPCDRGGRLYRDELEQTLRSTAQKVLGPGAWITGVIEPYVYFTPEARALDASRRVALSEACIAALLEEPEVARVLEKRHFTSACPDVSDESLEALVCRSWTDDAGDLYIVTKPGSFFDPELARGRGVNHGTPYLYDRTVPLFVRTPTRAHAGETVTSRLRPADFTRTAASLLGIQPPKGALRGRDVSQCDECFVAR